MKLTAEVQLTPAQLAEAFCEMNDESQAQFFIECARIGEQWKERDPDSHGAWWQWNSVGGHLRTCSCATPEARDMVRTIAEATEPA